MKESIFWLKIKENVRSFYRFFKISSLENKVPFKYDINEVLKIYTYFTIIFSTWFFFHGYLISLSWQDSLGISNLSVSIDLIKTKIFGGLDLLMTKWWLVFIISIPALFPFPKYLLAQPFEKLRNEMTNSRSLSFVIALIVYMILFSIAFQTFDLIKNPIKVGRELATEFKRECNCQQLILGNQPDSTILCKVVHFDKGYAVWMIDSTVYAQVLPIGSRLIYDPVFIAECEKE